MLEVKDSKQLSQDTIAAFGGDELRARVFYEKYALRNLEGEHVEFLPQEMWRRVAREIASVEVEEKRKEWEENFYWLLEKFRVVPGGRILFGAGNPRRSTLLNCYVIPIKEDSLEGIFDAAKEMARTYSLGGGCGTDISILRPAGSKVNNSAIYSTGAVSFMDILSMTTGTIGQAGRRGALMITINVAHPDVELFIDIKNDPERRKVRFANISLLVTDEFMKAVEEDEEWSLWYPDLLRTKEIEEEFGTNNIEEIVDKLEQLGLLKKIDTSIDSFYHYPGYMYYFCQNNGELRKKRVYKKVRAKKIWEKIVKNAWECAEPGVIFWSTIKRYSTTEYCSPVLTTNPCSEIPLEAYGDCCLANINLSAFVEKPFTQEARVNWKELEKAARWCTRFLDNVLDYNKHRHPLKQQSEASTKSRRIGVGFTALGDSLVMLGIKYDSQEALDFADTLFEKVKLWVHDESANLAQEKGSFPSFDPVKHLKSPFYNSFPEELREKMKKGMRNAALLTVPPVGSGSILAGTSSGIEPIFALWYTRRSESLSQEEFRVYHPLFKQYKEQFGIDDNSIPEIFVTAHEIDPNFRVKMQATIQKHIDHSISSTVNLPNDISVEEVSKIYFEAWKEECKGITVYREGSREGILITDNISEETEDSTSKNSGITPIPRPMILEGKTYKVKTDMGNVYITVSSDEKGNPIEVFVHLGKSGSTIMAFSEAIGRLVSLALRSRINPKDLIRQLEGIKSGPAIRQPEGFFVFSVPDAIAQALKKFLNVKEEKTEHLYKKISDNDEWLWVGDLCPECGTTMMLAGGCAACPSCGFSKCG